MRSGDTWADARGIWAPAPAALAMLRTEPRGGASSPSRQASMPGAQHSPAPCSWSRTRGVRPGWAVSPGACPSLSPACLSVE